MTIVLFVFFVWDMVISRCTNNPNFTITHPPSSIKKSFLRLAENRFIRVFRAETGLYILSRIMLKYIYTISIRAIWRCKTDRFSLQNGPFGNAKRTVLERKMASIGNLLIINGVQRRGERQGNVNYFYILLQVFTYRFMPN